MVKKRTAKDILFGLLVNDRFWLLCFSALLSVFVFVAVNLLVPAGELRAIRLQQVYGFISMTYLYFALLASPLTKAFPNLPGKEKYLFLRRAIGVSCFYFAALHAAIAFFGQLQGFAGLSFLSGRYTLSLILATVALAILLAMAATSVDKIIDFMTFRRWKALHRLIYTAGWLVFIHAVLIGTHFSGSNSLPGRIVFAAVVFLLLLEALRIDRNIKQRMPRLANFGVASMLVMHLLFVGFGYIIGRSSSLKVQDSHGHGGSSEPQTLTKPVGNQQVEINQLRFDHAKLLSGEEPVVLRLHPNSEQAQTECFFINIDTHNYVPGATKIKGADMLCMPAKDTSLPAGAYSVYVRLTGDQNAATKFDIDIQ